MAMASLIHSASVNGKRSELVVYGHVNMEWRKGSFPHRNAFWCSDAEQYCRGGARNYHQIIRPRDLRTGLEGACHWPRNERIKGGKGRVGPLNRTDLDPNLKIVVDDTDIWRSVLPTGLVQTTVLRLCAQSRS
jgi:hypothetical protein